MLFFSSDNIKNPPVFCLWRYTLIPLSRLNSFSSCSFGGKKLFNIFSPPNFFTLSSLSTTFHFIKLLDCINSGEYFEQSSNLIWGPQFLSASEITASFSMGLHEQVEWTNLPSDFNNWKYLFKVLNCKLYKLRSSSYD